MKILDRLSRSEKWLVLGGSAILLVVGLWLYVWQPLQQQRAQQEDRIARYLAVLDITDRIDPTGLDAAPNCTDTTALGPRVTRSAEAAGISVTRLDPAGPQLRITVAETAYAGAMMWIAALETQSCVRAASVEISRLTQPGQVSLQMAVEDAK